MEKEEIFKILNNMLKGINDCLEIDKKMKNEEDVKHWEKETNAIEGIINLYLKEKARADKLEKDYSKLLSKMDKEE